MRRSECVREADVLDALQTSAWPDCCAEELRAHVRGCQSCSELVGIVVPLLLDQRAAMDAARVPASGLVWWRLQMRARQEAANTAVRPIKAVQGLALVCASGILVAAAGIVSPEFRQFAAWLAGLGATAAQSDLPAIAWPELGLFGPLAVAAAIAVALFIVIAPMALYFVATDD